MPACPTVLVLRVGPDLVDHSALLAVWLLVTLNEVGRVPSRHHLLLAVEVLLVEGGKVENAALSCLAVFLGLGPALLVH